MNKLYRQKRTRAKIHGTEVRPRLSVNISNLHVSAQIINDYISRCYHRWHQANRFQD